MSSQEMVDRLRIMAESPAYAMRRGVLLVAAQNLEVMSTEVKALKKTEQKLQADLETAKLAVEIGKKAIAALEDENNRLQDRIKLLDTLAHC